MNGSKALVITSKRHGEFIVEYSAKDTDTILKYTWGVSLSRNKRMYARTVINNKREYLHRLLLGLKDISIDIDHINGNTLDNRRENLRKCTRSENMCNRGKNKNNTSGYKGVTWNKQGRNWKAQIKHAGKCYNLGHFKDIQDAVDAYAAAAKKYHKEFARTE